MQTDSSTLKKDKNNPTSKHDHTLEDKKFADPINYLQRE